jgi:unsaturated rhamnogalacturonyl hydrolase
MLFPAPEILSEALSRVAVGLARLKGINETADLSDSGYDLQFDEWDWEVGVGIYGLLRHAEAVNDRSLIDAIARWYDWQIGRGLPPRQVNSSSPMLPLCVLIDHVERPDWEELVRDWAQWLVTSLAKTEDGGFQHVVKERMNDGELWDDTLFMTCLFLARAGQRFGRQDWIEEAFYQFVVHERYLADPVTGLWYHGWTFNGRHNFAKAFWARGNSWITVAIPELFGLVDHVPDHLRRHLVYILSAQVKTLAAHQRENGMFHTLVCDPTSPEETSATAAIAYGILRGIDLGIVDEIYRPVAERALDAVLTRIDRDGIVLQVSDGTPMGHTLDFYRQIPNVPAPYGQALVMLLLARAMNEAGPNAEGNRKPGS